MFGAIRMAFFRLHRTSRLRNSGRAVGRHLLSAPAGNSIRQSPRCGIRRCYQHGTQQQGSARMNLPEDENLGNNVQDYSDGH
jgi:hypothetical protein